MAAVTRAKATGHDKGKPSSKSVSRQSPNVALAETTSRDPASRLLFACLGAAGQTYNGQIVIRGSTNGWAPSKPKARACLVGTVRTAGVVPVVVLLLCSLPLGQSRPPSAGKSSAPDSSATQSTGKSGPQDAVLGQARSLVQQGKLNEAERAVQQYLSTHASSADGHYLLGSIYFQEVHERASPQE